ncbi:hypothetical protein [Chromohalobacter canadensis]|nr:hypothetical protein [Chromohalobacter canadensis]
MYQEFLVYKKEAFMAMSQSTIVFDLARSAEKMCSWDNIGNTNLAWSSGPYLESPGNKQPIDRSFPYIIRTSIESQMVAKRIAENSEQEKIEGGRKIELPEIDGSRVEPYIARTSIIEQFEIFKSAAKIFGAPINKKQADKLRGKIDGTLLDRLVQVARRRNELAHQDSCDLPTMKEAVEYFYEITSVAVEFAFLADEGKLDNQALQRTSR